MLLDPTDHQLHPKLQKLLVNVPRIAGLIILIIGMAVLGGWMVNILLIQLIDKDLIPMAPATAIGFVLTGTIIILKRLHSSHKFLKISISVIAIFQLLVLTHVLSRYILKEFLQLEMEDWESLLVIARISAQGFIVGRMSPLTALIFFILIGGFLLSFSSKSFIFKISQIIYLIIFTISLMLIVGYLYGSPLLYGSSIVPVALSTSIAFLIASTGLLFDGPGSLFYRVSVGQSLYYRLIRHIIPFTITIIILSGMVQVRGYEVIGHKYMVLASALIAIFTATVLPLIIAVIARRVDRIEKVTRMRLESNEQKYRRLVELSPDGIAIHQDGKIVFANPAAFSLMGYQKKEEVIGKNAIVFVHPDYQEMALNRIKKALSGGGKQEFINEKFIRKDGSILDVEVAAIPIDYEGKPAMQVIFRDISMLKKEQEDLRELNATKDRFISILAHDLRNPFHGILGLSEVLTTEYDTLSDDERIKIIAKIRNSLLTNYKLINNLMEWAQINAGHVPITPSSHDLSELTEEALSMFVANAEQKEITIINNVNEGCKVYADRESILIILRNLISNAIKFTLRGGEILIESLASKDYVTVCVSDNGIGMDKSIRDKLFRIDHNVTRPGTFQEKGTGLGLILTRELVVKNKGNIWVESETDQGAKFCFTLPVKG